MGDQPHWLDDWDATKHPELLKWLSMPKKDFQELIKASSQRLVADIHSWVQKLSPEELAQLREDHRQYRESKPIWERKPNFYGSALDGLPGTREE